MGNFLGGADDLRIGGVDRGRAARDRRGGGPCWPAAKAKRAYPRGGPQRWAMDAVRPGAATATMGHRCCGNRHPWAIVAVRPARLNRIDVPSLRFAARADGEMPGSSGAGTRRPEPGPPLPSRNVTIAQFCDRDYAGWKEYAFAQEGEAGAAVHLAYETARRHRPASPQHAPEPGHRDHALSPIRKYAQEAEM